MAKVDPTTANFLDQLAEPSRGRAIDTVVTMARSAYTEEEIAHLREFNRALSSGVQPAVVDELPHQEGKVG